MTISRQEEINAAKDIINETIIDINKEIELVNSLISEYKKLISFNDKPSMVTELLEGIASLEKRISQCEKDIAAIVDNLANATDTVNKKKFLLIDSNKLVTFRAQINNLGATFHRQIHKNFFGTPKGQLILDLKNKKNKEIIQILNSLNEDILSPSINALSNIKSEFLSIEDSLRYKQDLQEQENHTDYINLAKDGFVTYYHATDDVSNFKNGTLQKRDKDFCIAKNKNQAIAHKSGFSAGGNFTIIKITIAKSLDKKFVKPYDVDSYVDADLDCRYINQKFFPEINNIIKSKSNLIKIEIMP